MPKNKNTFASLATSRDAPNTWKSAPRNAGYPTGHSAVGRPFVTYPRPAAMSCPFSKYQCMSGMSSPVLKRAIQASDVSPALRKQKCMKYRVITAR